MSIHRLLHLKSIRPSMTRRIFSPVQSAVLLLVFVGTHPASQSFQQKICTTKCSKILCINLDNIFAKTKAVSAAFGILMSESSVLGMAPIHKKSMKSAVWVEERQSVTNGMNLKNNVSALVQRPPSWCVRAPSTRWNLVRFLGCSPSVRRTVYRFCVWYSLRVFCVVVATTGENSIKLDGMGYADIVSSMNV